MNNITSQLLNEYAIISKLISDKYKQQEEIINIITTINKKLQKMNFSNVKNYILNIESLNINEEEKQNKILNNGKKIFGGLRKKERIVLLELYLLKKGTLRQNKINGIITQFHETILMLINEAMKSSLWLKRTISITPNIPYNISNDLMQIIPKIEDYKESLKLQDYYLANINIEMFLLEIQKEKIINKDIEEKLTKIIQNNNIEKNIFLKKLISKYKIKTALLTVLTICMFYTNTYAIKEKTETNEKSNEYIETITTSFNPIFPVGTNYTITALFGERIINKGSKNHKGIDVSCPIGTPIQAIDDGMIEIFNQGVTGYGLYVVITHYNGVKSLYAHGSKIPTNLKSGMMVKKGDIIMYSGNSGSSKGPHLHFEIIINEEKIDPLLYYKNILKDLKIKETIKWAQKESYNKILKMMPNNNS